MRIAIDIRLLARGGTTGIPGYTRELINELIAHHPEHEYALFYNSFSKKNPLPEAWRSAKNVTIHEHRIPNRLLNLSMRWFGFPTLEHFLKADVIWSPHFYFLPPSKTPRVITFHDLSFLHYPEHYSSKGRFWHAMQHAREQAQAATHLIAVSEATKQDLLDFYKISAGKINVIHSGVSSEFKKLAPNDSGLTNYRQANQLTRPYLLYLGTLEARKNLPLVIRAFSQLKVRPEFANYELVLAGKPGFGYEEIQDEIANCKCKNDIRLLGPVTDEERVYLYNQAKVFVFPSFFEGFGFPPLEAQACGTPVITSGRTSLEEILAGSALTINPWKPAELAQKIATLESDPKLREDLIQKGLVNAARFTWTTATKQTLTILENAARDERHRTKNSD